MRDAPKKRGMTASWSEEEGNVPDSLGRSARVCDLSISAIPGKDGGSRKVDLIENLLVSSGKPVLLVPESGLSGYPETIMICWDGSRSAARAMEAALPFLKNAKAIRLVTLKGVDTDTPGLDEAAAFLGMHGLEVQSELIAKPKGGLAKRILDEADNSDVDVIVMGGYSHRRFDEAIFGGVTRYMLNRSNRTILMAH
jgi:nucleotide-binding universal stress UspA family protein